ncbi:hypothetical protein VFPPC_15765 [Pochonia chlamydosporia 170]|uniref:Uncharacterized protein n=1 Tax=Pochonia chlamydosporia 170 TaxID=1380566 RepID=A0A179FS44_METCM|nr:hypothetical protein VFPPC_15765 [Pochonia chlamydosporia 170]OAQ68020.1 hypothetical protein VFPPC_15765 [Pochonia chlamydosporia 170]
MSMQRLSTRAFGLGRPALMSRIPAQRNFPVRRSSTGPATIVDTGFWTSLIPKPLRRESRKGTKAKKSKEWNPATFFIVMFLFIGSMSIQMIALRNQSERYNRQSTVRISQLREAMRRLQNGEDVNVDKLLGNADESQRDVDWEEMLKAIERDEKSQADQEAKEPSQEEVPVKTITSKAPVTETKATSERVNAEMEPTNPKSARLGNFF